MTARVDRLIAVLRATGIRLTPVEVAEAVWLALQVEVTGQGREEVTGSTAGPPATETGPDAVLLAPDDRVDLRLPVPAGPAPAHPEPEAPEPPASGGAAETDGRVELPAVPGWTLLVRTAAALPDSGRTMRALRPLRRRLPSARRVTIDEEATARRIAERRLWTPVWRPALERWLHLTLVLDHGSVGGVWDRLGHEVRILLERLGAFRTMRVVHLGRAGPAAAVSSLPGLTDRPGQQLVMVLSDCVSEPWRDGTMSQLLGHWARRAPVAILQPLPERLWSRTGLAPVPGRLRAPRAGAPAGEYSFASARRRRRLPEGSIAVPVLEIDPLWLSSWANLIAGRAVGGIDAVATPVGGAVPSRPAPEPAADPPADQRIREFRAGASAPAFRLARYLSAAVPLNIAVMRVVQAVMVPDSRPSHLAEVLYSGLLQPLSPDGAAADEQHFEFRPGVRQLLMSTLRRADAGRIYAEVSDYVERHLERAGASFTAVVSAPMNSLTVPALQQPFAGVRAEVLRRLAGGTGVAPGAGRLRPVRRDRERLTILQVHGPEFPDDRPSGPAPDLVVVTGVAQRATPAEYEAAYLMLERLRSRLQLPAGRIVVVPGPSDVNEGRCEAYFLDRRAEGLEPVPPYWPKWEPFAALANRLPATTPFQPHQPWQLHPVPAERTVVAALNSTVPFSHRPADRHGGIGEAQMSWFADRLRDYEGLGWLRVGVVHHDPASEDGDAGLFLRLLAPHLDVVLHGQVGEVRELGVTGVPAVGRRAEAQVVDLGPGTLRVSAGHGVVSYAFGDHWWFAERAAAPPPSESADPVAADRTDLVARVARAYRARHPGVPMVERQWPGSAGGYLVVDPAGESHCIGVFDGVPAAGIEERFLADVVRPEGSRRDAVLVCRAAADPDLRDHALEQGVRLLGFDDFQLGDDVLRFAGAQAATLDDPALPSRLYVPQPYTPMPGGAGADAGGADLLGLLRRRLTGPGGAMIAVAGASGTGKTFLLRELARRLHADHDPVLPILVDLRNLDWRVGLDELVAIQLSRGGIREVDLDRSRYLLREGRVALLCDGLDDLAARASTDRPRDRLAGWQAGAEAGSGRAKVVLVSREPDLLADALAPYATPDRISAVRLDGFGPAQILEFLTGRFGADAGRARFDLLGRVGDLLGMARNPRMLAFIADIDDELLVAAASGDRRVTVTALYEQLIREWLDGERRRAGTEETGEPAAPEDLWRAVTYLARRLWESGETALGADVLGAAADVLSRLAGARGAASPGRSASARLLGAGTLLARDPEYRFTFVDHSILEWLVAREIAGRLDPAASPARLRALLRREMSPLMVEFLCDLAGPERAGAWAQAVLADPTALDEARALAGRVLERIR